MTHRRVEMVDYIRQTEVMVKEVFIVGGDGKYRLFIWLVAIKIIRIHTLR